MIDIHTVAYYRSAIILIIDLTKNPAILIWFVNDSFRKVTIIIIDAIHLCST